MCLRTRSCSHFTLAEKSYQIFVFHSANHLHEWERYPSTGWPLVLVLQQGWPPLLGEELGVGVGRERRRERTHSVVAAPHPPLQRPSFRIFFWFRRMRGWDTGGGWWLWYLYIYLVIVIPIFSEMLVVTKNFGPLLYSSRQEMGTPTS